MTFGTRYSTLEEIVTLLEKHLGITMKRVDDAELGEHYSWSEEPNEFGMSFYGIEVESVWGFDPEDQEAYLKCEWWDEYTFVIGVSDELTSCNDRIRQLIEQGVLAAEETPEMLPES